MKYGFLSTCFTYAGHEHTSECVVGIVDSGQEPCLKMSLILEAQFISFI